MVPEQAPIITFDIKSAICMAKNGKDTKHTRHITRGINLVRNGEEWNLHKKVWYERGMQLEDIRTKNFMKKELNPGLEYSMVRLDNWKNTCQIGVPGYIRLWRTMCYECLNWIDLRTQLN